MLEGENLEKVWKAIIKQSFADLMNKGKKSKDKENRNWAKKWISMNNKEFIFICAFTDINPQALVDAKNKILKNNYSFRVFVY